MAESMNNQARPTDPVGRVLYVISYWLAMFGGLVLCGMALLTTVSVSTRFLISKPIPGDFEMIAIGTGVAIFAFLPLCQLMGENVIVDFFMSKAPLRVKSSLDTTGSLIYGFIIVLMTWRTSVGGVEIYHNFDTTVILAWPTWSTFPIAVFCLFILALVCGYTVIRSLNEVRTNRPSPVHADGE